LSVRKLLCGGHLLVVGRGLLGVGSERAGGDALRGGEVDHGARGGGDRDGDVSLQGAVAGRVVGHTVLPTAPHDPAPSTAEGAQRAGGGRGRGLVSRAVNSCEKSCELGKDLLGGLGPDERLGVLVPRLDPFADVFLERLD
jgi:hypothetical protein